MSHRNREREEVPTEPPPAAHVLRVGANFVSWYYPRLVENPCELAPAYMTRAQFSHTGNSPAITGLAIPPHLESLPRDIIRVKVTNIEVSEERATDDSYNFVVGGVLVRRSSPGDRHFKHYFQLKQHAESETDYSIYSDILRDTPETVKVQQPQQQKTPAGQAWADMTPPAFATPATEEVPPMDLPDAHHTPAKKEPEPSEAPSLPPSAPTPHAPEDVSGGQTLADLLRGGNKPKSQAVSSSTPEKSEPKPEKKRPASQPKAAEAVASKEPTSTKEAQPASTKAPKPVTVSEPCPESSSSATATATAEPKDSPVADETGDVTEEGKPKNAWGSGTLAAKLASAPAKPTKPTEKLTVIVAKDEGKGPTKEPVKEKAAPKANAPDKPAAKPSADKPRVHNTSANLAAVVDHYHVFIRNLPKDVTETDIITAFAPFAPVAKGMKIESKPPLEGPKDKLRTFAFVCLELEGAELAAAVKVLCKEKIKVRTSIVTCDAVREKPVFSLKP